jgi:hypothetical protein|tara:strand:+ start:368 stop:625 length:258 start_codon:yes stop_codon:yes gene_type:complete
MTKIKKRKINIIKLSILLLLINFSFTVSANEIICKKFDIKCKTSKFMNETKEFQKKGFKESKKQLTKTKDKIIKSLPKKNKNERK